MRVQSIPSSIHEFFEYPHAVLQVRMMTSFGGADDPWRMIHAPMEAAVALEVRNPIEVEIEGELARLAREEVEITGTRPLGEPEKFTLAR